LTENKKIYFVSDAHLGIDSEYSSDTREELLINWLDEIKNDAIEINLLGDIFDFWFEYKYVVPKGFNSFFAKLKELSNSGITINYFTGNHDMWTFGYISKVTGANLIKGTIIQNVNNKVLFMGHGDGLGPYDKKYNFLKIFFKSRFAQFLFKQVPSSLSFKIARSWSESSRNKHDYTKSIDYSDEMLVKYANTILEKEHIDFFIFGHRHIPFQVNIGENTVFTNIGDWLINFTYAVFDGNEMKLLDYKGNPVSKK
jgi:UDP-2,3-diacylglucosamine hydrolase